MQFLSRRRAAPRRQTEDARRPSHGYRVLALRRCEKPEIVWLTDERLYAIELAERIGAQLTKRWLAGPKSSGKDVHAVRSIRVERWTEKAGFGRWKEIWPKANDGTAKSRTRRSKRATTRLPGLPRSGDLVECVLLAEKTRRGGWKAKFVKLA